jgi:hypothetical protein
MAITKEDVVDKIEVLELGQVQVRTATRIKEDGVQISQAFSRHVVYPRSKIDGSWTDTDISGEAANVQAVATASWTNAVKTAYQAWADANSPTT